MRFRKVFRVSNAHTDFVTIAARGVVPRSHGRIRPSFSKIVKIALVVSNPIRTKGMFLSQSVV